MVTVFAAFFSLLLTVNYLLLAIDQVLVVYKGISDLHNETK